jgi:short-subunit dehydrogenase
MGPPLKGVYAATKAAQDAYAQALRAELTAENFHVTTIHPVATESEFRKKAIPPSASAGQGDEGSRPRFGVQSAEKVAGKIVASLRRPRAEVWPNPLMRFAVAAATALPGPTAAVLKRLHAKRQI